MSVRRRLFLLSLLLCVPVACTRGTGGGVVPAVPPGAAAADPAKALTATVRIVVGASAPEHGAKVIAYRHGGRKHPVASVVGSLAIKAPACKPLATRHVCRFPLELPKTGKYDFVIETFDRAPRHGKIPPGAHEIAAGIATANVTRSRTVKIALGGVVASTHIDLPVVSGPAIVPLAQTATVEAFDADGNTIVAEKYVGAGGAPVTIALRADAAAGNTITFVPASLTRPVTGVAVSYHPGVMNSVQATSGFTTVVSAVASNRAPVGTQALAFAAPVMNLNNIPTPGSAPQGIAAGADGALWFTEYGVSKIGRVTTAFAFTEYATTPPGNAPLGIANGPDGNIWFTGQTNDTIDRMTLLGAVTPYTVPTVASDPSAVAAGPDGALWFTEHNGNKIGRVTSSGSFVEYAIPTTNSYPAGIAAGADGALWFTECGDSKIGRITTTGSISEFSLPAGTRAAQIVAAPDTSLWFTTCEAELGRITTAGVAKLYNMPGETEGLGVGPDGAIWFGILQSGPTPESIGRMSLDATVFTQYTIPGSNPYPTAVVLGSDRALWFTLLNASAIGRLQ